jgi:hypothetical protein
LGALWSALELLDSERQSARFNCTPHPRQERFVPKGEAKRVATNTGPIIRECAGLLLLEPDRYVLRLEQMLQRMFTYQELLQVLDQLADSIVANLKREVFWACPDFVEC